MTYTFVLLMQYLQKCTCIYILTTYNCFIHHHTVQYHAVIGVLFKCQVQLQYIFLVCIGDVLSIACEPRRGLACVNSDQQSGKQCNDYRVRYLCPEGTIPDTRGIVCDEFTETSFTDRDNPGGHCDCETVNSPQSSCPGSATPAGIRCNDVTTGGDFAVFGQKMTCKPDVSEHNNIIAT